MKVATLQIIQTSDACISYRLHDANGRVVWSNRVSPVPAGHAGARKRMAEWALRNGYRVMEAKGGEAVQARRVRGVYA